MVSRRTVLMIPGALAAVVAFPRRAHAEPQVGAPFPSFAVRGLDGRTRTQRDFQGRRTCVLVMTGPDAQNYMDPWINEAESRLGRGRGNLFVLVALRLPFYQFDGIVRSETNRRTPAWRRPNLFLDRDGALSQALRLPNDDHMPWAYVVEPNGVVSVAAHVPVTHPNAQQVWAQMSAP